MRQRIFAFILFLLCLPVFANPDVKIVRIWPEWKSADQFERISEFFNGRENTTDQLIARTQTQSRDGFYFLVRINNTGSALPEAKVVIDVVRPKETKAIPYSFSEPLPAGKTVYQFGITGTDWPNAADHPQAWRFRLVNPEGVMVAEQKSFLWEPGAK